MNIKERLKAFIAFLNISEREFCRIIGMSATYVQSLGNRINRSTLNAIKGAYPLLNTEWLLTGRGEMLLKVSEADAPNPAVIESPAVPATSNDIASRLFAIVESQQRILEDNAATIKRLSEELAAQRAKLDALSKEGLRSGGSSLHHAPSVADLHP